MDKTTHEITFTPIELLKILQIINTIFAVHNEEGSVDEAVYCQVITYELLSAFKLETDKYVGMLDMETSFATWMYVDNYQKFLSEQDAETELRAIKTIMHKLSPNK